MDVAALEELGRERITWRFKGFPATFDGMTVAELLAARPALAELGTPLMYLDGAALTHNIETMAQYCAAQGVALAPHGKTSMAPQLFRRQLDAGAWGITAATIAHVRAYRAFGVPTVLLGNQLVDADALGWLAGELRRDPAFRFLCFVDSLAGVASMQTALAAHDAPRPVDVIVDVGAAGGRTGVRSIAEGVEVARAARRADRLRLVGVGGFEGAIGKDRSAADLAAVREFLEGIRALALRIDGRDGTNGSADKNPANLPQVHASLFDETDEIILTAGGSGYFDDVVDVFGAPWLSGSTRPVRTVLRSGAYVTHDHGHYTKLSPFRADRPDSLNDPNDPGHPAEAGPGPFQPALRIRGRVLSRPEAGLALLDFGKRDAPFDLGMPIPLSYGDGEIRGLSQISALADQHAFLRLDGPDQDGDAPGPAVGDIVTCGISHPCTAFDKWQLIPVVEDGHVVDLVRTFF
jgi:D-serine deaminase-like pyridoxal phosphate-dependent protein